MVYDESRWGRAGNPRESTYWKMHFDKHRVLVRVINSQSKHENDIGSYVIEVVEGAEASEYSKKLSRSTLRGCNDNASGGFSNGGTAPYGYRRVAVNKHTGEIVRELLPGERAHRGEEKVIWDLGEKEEVKIVKRIFELKSSGYGYRAIADILNKEAISCPKRGRWRNRNQMWASGTIQSISANPVYCGDRVYNRHPLSKKRVNETNILGNTKERWMGDERDWIIQKDAHPAIVSREIFKKVNARRKLGKRLNQHIYKSSYLLTGLVKCSKCGFNYQGQSYRKSNAYYYVDGGNMNKGRSVCERFSIRKEKLEEFVLDLIKKSLLYSKAAKRFEKMISEYLSKRSSNDSELKQLEKELEDVARKIANLLAAVEKGINLDTVLENLKGLEKRKDQLEHERKNLENLKGEKVDVKKAAKHVADFLQNFKTNFEKATIQEQKEMIRQIVIGVIIDPANRTATCAITKIPMVNRALTTLINPSEFMHSTHLVGAHCSGGRI